MHLFYLLVLLDAGVRYIACLQIPPPPPSKPTCNDVSKTNMGKLKKALFCGYDPSVRPVMHHSNRTIVKMAAFPTNIGWMMEEKNQVWMSFLIFLHWKDELLIWNASDYDGLDEFYTDGNKIWIPDISVADPVQSQLSRQISCTVHSDGDILCSMNTGVNARCNIDLTYFPHDRHVCRIVFRPPTYHPLSFKERVLDLEFMNTSGADPFKFFSSHGAWKLTSFKTNRFFTSLLLQNGFHTVDMEYTFIIERRSSSYNVTYATPALVMMMMVLSVFWLEVQCSARIILPGLAVLGHLIIMRWLMQAIHSNFAHLPVIIVLFRDSLLMTGLALVWSVAARSLCCSSSSPYWLYMVSINLNNSHLVKLLLPQDIFTKPGESGDEDESSLVVHRDCVEQQWRILTTLSDRLLFGLYTLTYMYFFMRLTP